MKQRLVSTEQEKELDFTKGGQKRGGNGGEKEKKKLPSAKTEFSVSCFDFNVNRKRGHKFFGAHTK